MKNMRRMAVLLAAAAAALALSLSAGAAETEAETEDPTLAEGYTESGDGWTSVVAWADNDGQAIFGKFYYPEDFDESSTWPVVIMSHGFMSTHQTFEKGEWAYTFAQEGYVSYIFDFCGGSKMSRSDGDFLDMSVMTEVSDLSAVMDYVLAQPYVNSEELFLLGASQGGLVSALTAAQRSDDVRGLMLLYPALCIVSNAHEAYPSIEDVPEDTAEMLGVEIGSQYVTDIYDLDVMAELAGYTGNVLIIHGTADTVVPYTWSLDALNGPYAESASQLVLLTGAETVHGFDAFREVPRQKALDAAKAYLAQERAAGTEE